MKKVWFVISIVLISCSPEKNPKQSSDFERLVEMHCRARKLKTKRFDLAEEMRENPRKGINYDSIRTVTSQASRDLSDSIRLQLQELTSDLSLEEKRAFNDSVEARIKRMGCD